MLTTSLSLFYPSTPPYHIYRQQHIDLLDTSNSSTYMHQQSLHPTARNFCSLRFNGSHRTPSCPLTFELFLCMFAQHVHHKTHHYGQFPGSIKSSPRGPTYARMSDDIIPNNCSHSSRINHGSLSRNAEPKRPGRSFTSSKAV